MKIKRKPENESLEPTTKKKEDRDKPKERNSTKSQNKTNTNLHKQPIWRKKGKSNKQLHPELVQLVQLKWKDIHHVIWVFVDFLAAFRDRLSHLYHEFPFVIVAFVVVLIHHVDEE